MRPGKIFVIGRGCLNSLPRAAWLGQTLFDRNSYRERKLHVDAPSALLADVTVDKHGITRACS